MARYLQVKVGSDWIDIPNNIDGYALIAMNGAGTFQYFIENPSSDQLSNIIKGAEIQFVDGDLTFSGVIQTADGEDRLDIAGMDYSHFLNKWLIHASNTSQEDATLSNNYTVVYTNKEVRDIVKDIVSGTGITADDSSVDAFGTINIKFKRAYVIEAIKELARRTGYYWYIDANKKLFFKSSLGSGTAVEHMNLRGDTKLLYKRDNDRKKCNKAVVFGAGNAVGTYSDITGETFERRFYFPDLRTDTECTAVATQMVNEFKDGELVLGLFTQKSGYIMGDTINLKGGVTIDSDYRVTQIKLLARSGREIEVATTGKKFRTDQYHEKLEKLFMTGQIGQAIITTGDSVLELVDNHMQPTSSARYWSMRAYIDPAQISDVLGVKLSVVRDYVPRVYGTTTGNDLANISQNNHDHPQNYFSQSAHDHTNPNKTSDSQSISVNEGNDSFANQNLSAGWNNDQLSVAINGTYDFLYIRTILSADFSAAGVTVGYRVHVAGNYWINKQYPNMDTGISTKLIRETLPFPIHGSIVSTVYVDLYSDALRQYDGWLEVWANKQGHSHLVASYDSNTDSAIFTDPNDTTGDTANLVDNQHDNPLNVNINEYDDGNSHIAALYVDSVFVQNITFSGIGATEELDISAYITTTGWHVIELRPASGHMFISGGLKSQVFKIEAE